MSEPQDNFFSRWSRRKQGLEPDGAPKQPASAAPSLPSRTDSARPTGNGVGKGSGLGQAAGQTLRPSTDVGPTAVPKSESPPTLEDVQQLTPASDFQSYMRQGVPGEVRNAAMKKLFTDPHFNVMDGWTFIQGTTTPRTPCPLACWKRWLAQSC